MAGSDEDESRGGEGGKRSHLKILSININGIRCKQEHILRILKEQRPDVLAIQETRTQENVPFHLAKAMGYHTLSVPAYKKNAGLTSGLCLLIHEDISAKEIPVDNSRNIQQVELFGMGANLLLFNVYSQPE